MPLLSVWLFPLAFLLFHFGNGNETRTSNQILQPNNANEAVIRGREWILSRMDSANGWGDETHRMITTLILSGDKWLKGDQYKLTVKQLELQLAVALAKYHTNPISSGQLALYINSLIALCKNPRNFYGISLVSKLKHYHEKNTSTLHPYVLALKALAMCNAGIHLDTQTQNKLIEIANGENRTETIPDSRALTVIALSCTGITEKTNYYNRLRGIRKAVKDFKKSQNPLDGSFGNIYSSAIVHQALLAAETSDEGWNKTKSIEYILSQQNHDDGSFQDTLAAYFALPALAGNSFASINLKNCSQTNNGNITNQHDNSTVQIDPNVESVVVDIVVWVGSRLAEFRNNRVAKHSTLYQVLNSQFSCDWKETSFGPMLISLDGSAQNPATNTYWLMYKMERDSNGIIAEKSLSTGAGQHFIDEDSEFVLRLN